MSVYFKEQWCGCSSFLQRGMSLCALLAMWYDDTYRMRMFCAVVSSARDALLVSRVAELVRNHLSPFSDPNILFEACRWTDAFLSVHIGATCVSFDVGSS